MLSARNHLRVRQVTRHGRQRGQALVETAILGVILVPLFLLVPIIAKYFHAKQMAQQAARAAAWEATVSEDYALSAMNGGLEDRRAWLIDRHFNAAGVPVRTMLPAEYNSMSDNSFLGNALFNTFSNQPLVTFGDITVGDYRFNDNPATLLTLITPGERRSLVTSEVNVAFQNLKARDGSPATYLRPFDSIDLSLTATNTLLADTWTARGSGARRHDSAGHNRSVLKQIRTLAPREFSQVGEVVVDVVGLLPTIFPGPRHTAKKYDSRVMEKTLDMVPPDRLRPYSEVRQ